METQSLDIKKMYLDFIESKKAYYEKQASFCNPEEMYFQYVLRHDIISELCDLLRVFADKSLQIMCAFDKYHECARNTGDKDLFDGIIGSIVKLINEREEIYKWSYELYLKVELLKEKNISDMEPSDIEKLAS